MFTYKIGTRMMGSNHRLKAEIIQNNKANVDSQEAYHMPYA